MVFGVLRASPLIAVLACFAGLEGTFRYARARGAGTLGAMLAAPLFALSGFFPRSAAFEWVNFLGFQLLPWAALGLRRAFGGDIRGAVLAAVAVGWMTCFGGTYAAPYTVLVALWELIPALVTLVRRRRGQTGGPRGARFGAPFAADGGAQRRASSGGARGANASKLNKSKARQGLVLCALISVLLAAGIAAVRLWPIAETLAAAPRILGAWDVNTPIAVIKYLFGWGIPFRGDFLVGVLVLPFAVWAALERRNVWALGAACYFLCLSSGYAAQPTGYAVLRTIPPFTMLRSPERFLVPFALFYAVLAARGLGRIEAFVRRRRWTPGRKVAFALTAVTLAVVNDGVLVDNDWSWQRGRTLMERPTTAAERPFANARGDRWLAVYYPGLDRGTLSCFDDYQIPQSPALAGDLQHEEWVGGSGRGKVDRVAWSPNSITLHAELPQPGRVIVNQNWHPGWHSTVGDVVSDQERLAVDLPAGTQDSRCGSACVRVSVGSPRRSSRSSLRLRSTCYEASNRSLSSASRSCQPLASWER